MSELSSFEDWKAQQGKPTQCKTCKLAPALRGVVDTLLNRGEAATQVHEWLRAKHSIGISETSLRKHRNEHAGRY